MQFEMPSREENEVYHGPARIFKHHIAQNSNDETRDIRNLGTVTYVGIKKGEICQRTSRAPGLISHHIRGHGNHLVADDHFYNDPGKDCLMCSRVLTFH